MVENDWVGAFARAFLWGDNWRERGYAGVVYSPTELCIRIFDALMIHVNRVIKLVDHMTQHDSMLLVIAVGNKHRVSQCELPPILHGTL